MTGEHLDGRILDLYQFFGVADYGLLSMCVRCVTWGS